MMGSESAQTNGDMRLVTTFLTAVLQPSAGTTMNLGTERELRTLAESMDLLLSGKVAEAGDVMMQRFRALEVAAADGTWEMAKFMELIPESTVSCVPVSMRQEAVKRQVLHQKVAGVGRRRDRPWREPISAWKPRATVEPASSRGPDVTFDLTPDERPS